MLTSCHLYIGSLIADWSVLDFVGPNGSIQRITTPHAPEHLWLVHKIIPNKRGTPHFGYNPSFIPEFTYCFAYRPFYHFPEGSGALQWRPDWNRKSPSKKRQLCAMLAPGPWQSIWHLGLYAEILPHEQFLGTPLISIKSHTIEVLNLSNRMKIEQYVKNWLDAQAWRSKILGCTKPLRAPTSPRITFWRLSLTSCVPHLRQLCSFPSLC